VTVRDGTLGTGASAPPAGSTVIVDVKPALLLMVTVPAVVSTVVV
jgi:hypothetical protein